MVRRARACGTGIAGEQIAGIVVLILPRLLNDIVALSLIVIGLVGRMGR